MNVEVISKFPSGSPRATPLLFVHGMMHAAWCWDMHFLDYFALHGYAAHAVNLRGHGNSAGREKLRWAHIVDYVDDVANAVRQLTSPPILIGHSMGGFVIQKYLEDHSAAGAVLLSSPPPSGLLPTALRIARRQPMAFARCTLTFSLLPVIAAPELVREAFFSQDLPDSQLVSYWEQMQDESYRAFLDMVALDLPQPHKIKTLLDGKTSGAVRRRVRRCSGVHSVPAATGSDRSPAVASLPASATRASDVVVPRCSRPRIRGGQT